MYPPVQLVKLMRPSKLQPQMILRMSYNPLYGATQKFPQTKHISPSKQFSISDLVTKDEKEASKYI